MAPILAAYLRVMDQADAEYKKALAEADKSFHEAEISAADYRDAVVQATGAFRSALDEAVKTYWEGAIPIRTDYLKALARTRKSETAGKRRDTAW
jgi:hypothetical protein